MTQRAGVLCELPQVLRDLGVDVATVFRGSGVDPSEINPNTRVPFNRLLNLLHGAEQATNCPHLGLLIGLRFTFDIHGPIGQLMLSAATVRDAFSDFVIWQPGYSSGAIVYLNRYGDEYAIGYGSLAASCPGSKVLYDAIIGVGVQMLRKMTNGAVKPVEIHFSHHPPEHPTDYARLLRVPVRYNQHRTCLILDEAGMQMALPSADSAARRNILARIRNAAFQTPPDVSTLTRQAIRRVMLVAKPTLPAVAFQMGVHPRTLERRLAKKDQTFGLLRDAVRFSVAKELLELTDIPLGDIAAHLWYASPGVFSGAFRRLSGTTPSEWRAEAPRIKPSD